MAWSDIRPRGFWDWLTVAGYVAAVVWLVLGLLEGC